MTNTVNTLFGPGAVPLLKPDGSAPVAGEALLYDPDAPYFPYQWGDAALPASFIESGTFTPTFTFQTPGNLSVSYSAQEGHFYRIGDLVHVQVRLGFTPTHSTASGQARVEGLPFQVNSAWSTPAPFPMMSETAINYPGSRTWLAGSFILGTTFFAIDGQGEAAVNSSLNTLEFVSGGAQTLRACGVYVRTAP